MTLVTRLLAIQVLPFLIDAARQGTKPQPQDQQIYELATLRQLFLRGMATTAPARVGSGELQPERDTGLCVEIRAAREKKSDVEPICVFIVLL